MGFFIDSNPAYHLVKVRCSQVWKPGGGLSVHFDNAMFYFKLSRSDERQRILEAYPILIDGKLFIITSWTKDQVLSIPVWVHFSHILSILQSLIGIDWLAGLVGNVICYDANTVARKILVYAKALIGTTPVKSLPTELKVRLDDDQFAEVRVRYCWKPEMCTFYQSFGNLFRCVF